MKNALWACEDCEEKEAELIILASSYYSGGTQCSLQNENFVPYTVTDANETYCDDHFTMCTNTDS